MSKEELEWLEVLQSRLTNAIQHYRYCKRNNAEHKSQAILIKRLSDALSADWKVLIDWEYDDPFTIVNNFETDIETDKHLKIIDLSVSNNSKETVLKRIENETFQVVNTCKECGKNIDGLKKGAKFCTTKCRTTNNNRKR